MNNIIYKQKLQGLKNKSMPGRGQINESVEEK